jgi:DNA-binding TFAR19-related protein (PDSD5 family)
VWETSSDIEFLKQKKALELRRKMLLQQGKQAAQTATEIPQTKKGPREIVRGILAGRGVEVLETARRYYPEQIAVLEQRIAEAVQAGRLKGPVSGEELYSFLRSLRLDFSMDIKIRVSEKGKLKTLEEKFRERNY